MTHNRILHFVALGVLLLGLLVTALLVSSEPDVSGGSVDSLNITSNNANETVSMADFQPYLGKKLSGPLYDPPKPVIKPPPPPKAPNLKLLGKVESGGKLQFIIQLPSRQQVFVSDTQSYEGCQFVFTGSDTSLKVIYQNHNWELDETSVRLLGKLEGGSDGLQN